MADGGPGRPRIDHEEVAQRRRVSARYALTTDEREFCRRHLAFGEAQRQESYRRTFLIQHEGKWYDRDSHGGPNLDKRRMGDEITKLVDSLLGREHIQAYIEELKKPASEHARDALADDVRFGKGREKLSAATKILEQEDKLGQRDAVELWGQIMSEIGAEIVVPLPTTCHACGARQEVAVEMAEMFPQWKRKDAEH